MTSPELPLSPHLQIYRWQVTMLLSILHRVAGVGLALGAVLLTALFLAAASGESAFDAFHALCRHPLARLVLLGFTWAFVFHLLNGLRHLAWDTGRGFEKHTAARSAWVTLAASVVFAGFVWCAGGGFGAAAAAPAQEPRQAGSP